ncbi:MAG: MBOAT family protein [Prevotella sp.]|nr:MBOAT family protein [Prevotella sp.]
MGMNQLINFFTTQTEGWSIMAFPFMVAFVVFYACYLLIRRSRGLMMAYVIAFSLLFAWKANGVLMVLLPLTAVMTWLMTEAMRSSRGDLRRFWLATTILSALAPLLYYKYTNFFLDTLNELLATNFSPLSLLLPVGISFYTFQIISYAVDVYKRRFTLRTSLTEYLFYITFFPLLVAGPITRASTLLPQIKNRSPFTNPHLPYIGLWLIISGLLKKMVVADYIAQYNNWIFDDPTAFSGFEGLMGIVGFTLQIYCDFAGYSDMSIGLAALMGFQLKENFRFPYQSRNLTEFWHRWHISLSTWFRDYVYIPLGGNRHGRLRTCVNSFLTMLVAGLWHGASWMFVIWGVLHGLGLVVHKLLKPWLDRVPDTLTVRCCATLLTFVYVSVAWVFFRSADMSTALALFHHVGSDFSLSYLVPFVTARPLWMAIVVGGLLLCGLRERHVNWLQQTFIRMPWIVKLLLFAGVMWLVTIMSQSNVRPFVYAQF